ncbi:MAG: haloacid dehalogenase type II [Gammaproteobacteria bacterium]|nr:haloacid dehalogenase type II [Gammaproteobacteria bacterium]
MTESQVENLRHDVTTLVFDLYGTVVDMQTGLTEMVRPFLKEKRWNGDPHRFVTWWRRVHFENSMIDALCDRGHTPYREIGHRAVAHVMDRSGIPYSRQEVRWLVSRIERLEPFPDVLQALRRLKQRYGLAVLSNGDRDMLEAARPHIGFEFDAMISVEEAGYFKPHFATYAKACEILGTRPSAVLFVANHAFDCIGAKAHGMRTAFIDRRRRPFGETPHGPDLIVKDFRSLADLMCAAG